MNINTIASTQELFSVLSQYNPWWNNTHFDIPNWKRAAFKELSKWALNPPANRAILISGARQVGKTTLILQLVEELIKSGVNPKNIIYATFDHPLLKLIGIEKTIAIWKKLYASNSGVEYILFDEIQYTDNWQTWLKHQIDFIKKSRIIVTGSAMPLETSNIESGVGRWHTIKLPTLSFYEYLQIKKVDIQGITEIQSLKEVFGWSPEERIRTADISKSLVPHFHEYLLKGGFPQTALIEEVTTAQKLTREDIVDKVLKRDMTAIFGVRRVLELERLFLYLCLHDGGILDMAKICENLDLKKPTVNNFINLLESAHLIYCLRPYGLGKEVLRGKTKVYLADPSIAGSVMLKGRSLLEDPAKLGAAVEAAFFKHLVGRYYQVSPSFHYFRGTRGIEVDIIATVNYQRLVPFEVKYTHAQITLSDVKGLLELCKQKQIPFGYIITGNPEDFLEFPTNLSNHTKIMKIPAALACYWLSKSEYTSDDII